jgi:hypothetical protein
MPREESSSLPPQDEGPTRAPPAWGPSATETTEESRVMEETTHARTLEAMVRCKFGPGSCHDCAMTCPHGNQVRDDKEQLHPCGSDVFDRYGNILLCGECRQAMGEQ